MAHIMVIKRIRSISFLVLLHSRAVQANAEHLVPSIANSDSEEGLELCCDDIVLVIEEVQYVEGSDCTTVTKKWKGAISVEGDQFGHWCVVEIRQEKCTNRVEKNKDVRVNTKKSRKGDKALPVTAVCDNKKRRLKIKVRKNETISFTFPLSVTDAEDISLADDSEDEIFFLSIRNGSVDDIYQVRDSPTPTYKNGYLTLLFNTVQCEDENIYNLHIHSSELSERDITRSFELIVQEIDQVAIRLEERSPYCSATAEIQCVSDVPVFWIKWLRNDKDLQPDSDHSIKFNGTRSAVVIPKVDGGNTETYQCIAHAQCSHRKSGILTVESHCISTANSTADVSVLLIAVVFVVNAVLYSMRSQVPVLA